jgi:hypothetical protein
MKGSGARLVILDIRVTTEAAARGRFTYPVNIHQMIKRRPFNSPVHQFVRVQRRVFAGGFDEALSRYFGFHGNEEHCPTAAFGRRSEAPGALLGGRRAHLAGEPAHAARAHRGAGRSAARADADDRPRTNAPRADARRLRVGRTRRHAGAPGAAERADVRSLCGRPATAHAGRRGAGDATALRARPGGVALLGSVPLGPFLGGRDLSARLRRAR